MARSTIGFEKLLSTFFSGLERGEAGSSQREDGDGFDNVFHFNSFFCVFCFRDVGLSLIR